jgi:hypothetical protein
VAVPHSRQQEAIVIAEPVGRERIEILRSAVVGGAAATIAARADGATRTG